MREPDPTGHRSVAGGGIRRKAGVVGRFVSADYVSFSTDSAIAVVTRVLR